MTTTTPLAPLQSKRLFRDETFTTIVDRALKGRTVLVAGSSITASLHLMSCMEMLPPELGGVPARVARVFRTHSEERIEFISGGRVVFSSVGSDRVLAVRPDVAIISHLASDTFLAKLLPAMALGGADEPELFEIDL